MAPVVWELLLFWVFRYMSLITCCSAKDDAVGARVVLRRPRSVIHITRGVIDKAGLNWLLVPHQSPFSLLNQLSLLLIPPCLTSPAPTPFRSILFVMVQGSSPLPRRCITVNALSTRGGLGPLPTHPLSTSIRGQNGPLWRPIPLTTFIWVTSYRPTKGMAE
jgi:hypothetical protein